MRLTLAQFKALSKPKRVNQKIRLGGTEAELQTLCVAWFRTEPRFKRWAIVHIPNQGSDRAHPGRVANLIRQGMIPGIYDLLVLDPSRRASFIEMKKGGGKPSDDQVEFAAWCDERKIPNGLADSFNKFQACALDLLRDYESSLTAPVRKV